jgi:predicted transcriptional regulator YdeE
MQNLLMRLFVYDIEGIEPRIVDLQQPILLVGMSVDTDLRRIYRDVPAVGKRYRDYKRTHAIPNKKEPWAFAAVSKGYDQAKGTLSYTLGDVVTALPQTPEGLVSLEIPALKYAIFPVRPKNRFGWPLAIANTKRYAYTVWLPKSGYEPAGVIDDFEYHDERSTRKSNPEVDLYVAIRPKG